MRCSCKECQTYMIQADDLTLGCICPNCGERCTACLGTNTVISKEKFKELKNDSRFSDFILKDIKNMGK